MLDACLSGSPVGWEDNYGSDSGLDTPPHSPPGEIAGGEYGGASESGGGGGGGGGGDGGGGLLAPCAQRIARCMLRAEHWSRVH